MNTNDEKSNYPVKPKMKEEGTGRKIIVTVIVALVVLGAVWIWKSLEINNIKKQANNQLAESGEIYAKLVAKPFGWAVRTEMLNNNISQVNLYANELVKERNIKKVLIVNDKGMVLVSTNKKDEGKAYSTIGTITYLSVDTTLTAKINDSLMIIINPVMGLNNRIGTVMITYSYPSFKIK